MIRQAGSRALAFVRSVLLLAVLVIGTPWALIAASRSRFGGAAPLHGVPSPADWQVDEIRHALTDRLSEQTIADIVIRVSLIVAWIAVIVLVVTVVAEVVHMIRHDGLAMPELRGFAAPQSLARLIATGLLVIVPMFSSPSRADARDGVPLRPERWPATALVSDDGRGVDHERPVNVWTPGPGQAVVGGIVGHSPGDHPDEASASSAEAPGRYVVRPGDSIFGIAERLAGPDPVAVADFAERMLELNLGTTMVDGQRFTNAAYIEVGWSLELPSVEPGPAESPRPAGTHLVELGESLWSIAADELGDGTRWPEIFDSNQGRTFDDGRQLVDPDLIQPGWRLDVPIDVPAGRVETTASDPVTEAQQSAPLPENVWEPGPGVAPASDPGAAVGADADHLDDSGNEPVPDRSADADAALPAGQRAGIESFGDLGDPVVGDRDSADEPAPRLLTYPRAAMLSAGVLTLLAVRRRNQLRRARPRARLPQPSTGRIETERALRAIDPGDRLARLDGAIRAASGSLIDSHQRVVAALIGADGDLELRLSGDAVLPPPWHGAAGSWHLPGSTPLELLPGSVDRVGSPCPTLVQLGRDPLDRDVYVDLEACLAIEVGGPADDADAIVAAIATTLAGSVFAEVTTLVGLGVPDDAFLGHRLHVPVSDPQRAFEAAREAVGSTASADRSTFELRAGGGTGETWEPAVVLVGSAAGTIRVPSPHIGLAVVSASPIHGPSSRLAPDGDAWTLQPLDIRLQPIGLSNDDITAIAELVDVTDPMPEASVALSADPDLTLVGRHDDDPHDAGVTDRPPMTATAATAATAATVSEAESSAPAGAATEAAPPAMADRASDQVTPPWKLMVRLLGSVDVVGESGDSVSFERSKTRELVAWLATHRDRSTRTAARTALWELDVRDATFANVVSEARRSLARLVAPPDGEEWVGRTMTEALPLHELVCTDADLVGRALDAARLQPPAQAVATLSPAVDLITGMPFAGTSYLWPDPEGITSSLVLLATSASAELAAHCLSLGDVAGVFDATGRGLQVLPGHEELIGLRMRAHAQAGDHAGVRHEWESYERVITADPWSDGEPSPKLVELRSELLNPSR